MNQFSFLALISEKKSEQMSREVKKAALPQLNSLWIGDELHPVHRLCLSSAVYHGHRVRLFTYGAMRNVPEGVELAEAEHVLPRSAMFLHKKTGSPAPFADRFRIKLIGMGLGAWIDTDILFVKPLEAEALNVFGWESGKLVGNAILQLDPESDLFHLVNRLINDDFLTPPWLSGYQKAMLKFRNALGLRKHVGAMSYGTTGPDLLTWALRETGNLHLARPQQAFYPLPYLQKTAVFRKNSDWYQFGTLPDDVVAVHLWFQGLLGGIHARAAHDAVPEAEAGSFLHDAAKQMGIDFA